MDIELPDGNGMEIARRLRKTNKRTLIIFVTNLAQYAVKGYEVRAFDFVVKPVSYYNFMLKFSAALDNLELNKDTEIWIKSKEGRVRLPASRIIYVEVLKHYLTYHTKDGDSTALGSIGGAGGTRSVCRQTDAPFSRFAPRAFPERARRRAYFGIKAIFRPLRRTSLVGRRAAGKEKSTAQAGKFPRKSRGTAVLYEEL